VFCVWDTPVASFLAVTDAPGTTAPLESVTVPAILDVLVWAWLKEAASVNIVRQKRKRQMGRDMDAPPHRLNQKDADSICNLTVWQPRQRAGENSKDELMLVYRSTNA
jgi:hypothetical protein